MTEQFKIEAGIPIPKGRALREKYPLGEMEVGDSFEAPADQRSYIDQAKSRMKQRTGKEFTCRRQPNGKVRIWRIK